MRAHRQIRKMENIHTEKDYKATSKLENTTDNARAHDTRKN